MVRVKRGNIQEEEVWEVKTRGWDEEGGRKQGKVNSRRREEGRGRRAEVNSEISLGGSSGNEIKKLFCLLTVTET